MTPSPPPPPSRHVKHHDSFDDNNNNNNNDSTSDSFYHHHHHHHHHTSETPSKTTKTKKKVVEMHHRVDPSHPISSLPFITSSTAVSTTNNNNTNKKPSSSSSSQKSSSSSTTPTHSNLTTTASFSKFCSLGTGKIRERRIAILLSGSLLLLIVLLGPNGLLERNSPYVSTTTSTNGGGGTNNDAYHMLDSSSNNNKKNQRREKKNKNKKKGYKVDSTTFKEPSRAGINSHYDYSSSVGGKKYQDEEEDNNNNNEFGINEQDVVDVDYAPLSSTHTTTTTTTTSSSTFQIIKEIDDTVPSSDTTSTNTQGQQQQQQQHASDELECRDSVIAFVINATDVRDECEGLRKAFDTTCSATTTSVGGAGRRNRRRLREKKELMYQEVILDRLYKMFTMFTKVSRRLFFFREKRMEEEEDDDVHFFPEDEITKVWKEVRQTVTQEGWNYDNEEYQMLAASLLSSSDKSTKKDGGGGGLLTQTLEQNRRRHLQQQQQQQEEDETDEEAKEEIATALLEISNNNNAEEEEAASEDPIAAAKGEAPIRPSLSEQEKNLKHQQEEQEKSTQFIKEVQQQLLLSQENQQQQIVHMPMSPSLPTSSEHVESNMLNEALLLQQDGGVTNAEILAKKVENDTDTATTEGDEEEKSPTQTKQNTKETTTIPSSPEKKAAQAQAAASSAAISQTAAAVSTLFNDPESVEARTCCASILKVFHEHCDQPSNKEYTDERLFVIVAVIGFCGMVKSLIRYFRLRWLPEAAGCILVGVVGGYILTFVPHFDIGFDGEFFLRIMVPPIVFEAALSIDKRSFNRHFTPILIYATAGTLLSTGVTAFIVHRVSILLGGWCPTIGVAEALTFGALISSIDPIAVLSVLSSMGMTDTDTIYVVIFGESLLNDGVAIVLFETLVHFLDDSLVIDTEAVLAAGVHFFVVAIGSVAVGLACGALSTVYYWMMHGCHTPLVEVLMFFCWSFIPYYVADGIKWSGIVAVVAAGFVMDLYIVGQKHGEESASQFDDVDEIVNGTAGFETVVSSREWTLRRKIFSREGHLSRKARSHVGFVTEINAALMETAIFAYLGLFLFSSRYHWNFALSITAIFACIVSRGVVVPVFGAISNCISALSSRVKNQKYLSRISHCRDNLARSCALGEHEDFRLPPPIASVHIDPRMQIILWFAGLRGAMSFALVENIPLYDTVTGEGTRLKPELKAMTSATIMFTVFILGGATSYVLEKLGYSVNRDAGFVEMASPLVSNMEGRDDDDDKNSDADTASNSSANSSIPKRDKEISEMMKDGPGTERLVRHRVPGVGTFSSFA